MTDKSNSIDVFFESGEDRLLKVGDHVVSVEKKHEEIYFIKKGYIKAYATNKKGKQFVYIIFGKGEIFPMERISNVRDLRIVHFQALGRCKLQVRSRHDTQHEAVKNPIFAKELSELFARQSKRYSARVLSLEHTFASERLAACLLLLSERFGVRKGTSIYMNDLSLSHQTLGDTSNITREVVSREMKILIDKGIISNHHQQVVILNVDLLSSRFLKVLANK